MAYHNRMRTQSQTDAGSSHSEGLHQQHHHQQKHNFLANTFKMAPDKEINFKCKPVKEVMESALENKLKDLRYNPNTCKNLCMELSTEIKNKIKLLGFSRHKLICQVLITSLSGQSMRIASRFIWDERHDTYVTASYKTSDVCAVAVIYGVYQE